MAKDIYINPTTGDLDITNGLIRLTKNKQESSAQQVSITLSTYKGEWIFNINLGIPYLANRNNPVQLLGKEFSKGLLDTLIKEAILKSENAIRIINYESIVDKINNNVKVSFSYETDTGEVISVEEVDII